MKRLSFEEFMETFIAEDGRQMWVDPENPIATGLYLMYRFGYRMGYLAGKLKSGGSNEQ